MGTALVWDLIARDAASPVYNRVADSANRAAVATRRAGVEGEAAGRKFSALGKGLAAFGIADVAVHMVKAAATFQRSMLLIQTQAGASSAEVKKMSGAILGIAGAVGTGPEKLATSLYHVESVGLRGAKALEVVKIAAEGAKIGNADLEETTNALTSAVASGIPGVKSMTQAMGALNAIVGSGDMNLQQLNEALGTGILTKARTYGLSLTDVGASLATFGDLNIRGADAATQLRMAFEAMAKPAAGGVKFLNEWGLSATRMRTDMQQGGLNKALTDLRDHLIKAGITGNRVGGALLDAFGKKGASGVTLLLTNFARFQTKLHEVHDGATKFGSAWAATTKTASFAMDQVRAGVEAIGIKVGTWLLPVASAAFRGIAAVVQALNGTLGKLTLVALGAWAAFKAGAIIADLLGVIQVKALNATIAMQGMRTASLGLGASLSLAGGAAALIVVGLNAFADANRTVAASADTSAKILGDFNKSGDLTADMLKRLGVSSGHLGSVVENSFHESTWTKIKDFQFGLGNIIHTPFNSATDDAKNFFQSVNGGLKQMLAGGDLSGAHRILAGLAKQSGLSIDKLESKMPGLKAAFKDAAAAVTLMSAAQARALLRTELHRRVMAATTTTLGTLAAAYGLSDKQAQSYADMLGMTVDRIKAGDVSSRELAAGIRTVATAYDRATQTGDGFLKAVDTFAKSGGTAADRAALIGATLKAANGDALNFAAQMNGASVASHTFFSDIRANAKSAKDSIHGYLKSLVNLRTGTIDYRKAGAAPLISDLSSMQTAAMNAAQAMFQHSRAVMGGKAAADAAYKVYVAQTRGQFIDTEGHLTEQAKRLGITEGQAKKLSDRYFGMPKNVKTLIEQQGANPIVSVLNKIGRLLARMAGVQWTVHVNTDDAQGRIDRLQSSLQSFFNSLGSNPSLSAQNSFNKLSGMNAGRASGGAAPEGWFAVGEQGPELVHKRGGRVDILSNPASKAFIRATGARFPGFASGTGVERAFASLLASLGVGRAGQAGVLGNALQESGFNTRAINSIGATGMFQWLGGRLAGLRALAARMGTSATTEKAQLAFFRQELLGPFHSVLNGLRHATSARAAATLFNQRYEISGDNSGTRENNAARIYGQLASMGIGGGSGGRSASAAHTLAARKIRIETTDVLRIVKALGTSVADTKKAFAMMFTDVARAGGSGQLQRALTVVEDRLVSVQSKALAAKSKLTAMLGYGHGIRATLDGAFDPTKAGSIADLISGMTTATGTNNAYRHELNLIRHKGHGNKTLLAFVNKLAASGQTATLATLAGASRSELGQVAKAVGGYNKSVWAGGEAAVAAKYGQSAEMQARTVHHLATIQGRLMHVVGQLAHEVGHQKITIGFDGEHLAAHVTNSHEMKRLLSELEHLMAKGLN